MISVELTYKMDESGCWQWFAFLDGEEVGRYASYRTAAEMVGLELASAG